MIAAFELPNRVSTVSAETVAQIGFVPKRVDRKETVGRNRPQRKKKKAQRGRGGEYNDWFNGPSVIQLKGYLKYIRAREPDSEAAKIKLSQKKSELAKAFAADTSDLLTPDNFAAWKANETISTASEGEDLEDIAAEIDADGAEQEASLASDQTLVDIAAGIDADSFIELTLAILHRSVETEGTFGGSRDPSTCLRLQFCECRYPYSAVSAPGR